MERGLKYESKTRCAEIGSGKTLIAVLLLKDILQRELINRSMGEAPRIAFFLVSCSSNFIILCAKGEKVDSVTLVFQQAAVLRNNINQNVGHFYGNMGVDLWDKQTWDNHFEKNMVVVCTAEILNQCLLNGFVKIGQINLMIFDEAHHTKKDHPYARLVPHIDIQTPLKA